MPLRSMNGKAGRGSLDDTGRSQDKINVEARDTIKDLFPNIPKKDLDQIIKTAFQKVRYPFLVFHC